MNRDESDRLWTLVRRLQRAPEALDDVEARRALTVLTASRSDAAYLLLQRVLVLELALEHVRAQRLAEPVAAAAASASAVAVPAAAAQPAAPALASGWRPSPFLRDAAVIATGVVGGGLVLGALDSVAEAGGGLLADGADGLGGVGDLL